MKIFCLSLFLFTMAFPVCRAQSTSGSSQPVVKLGVEVLFEKHLDLIRGKRIGLITNPSGVDSHLDSIVELFRSQPDVHLVALYGPEHGVRGDAQAGQSVSYYFDKHYQLPVYSLYGQSKHRVGVHSKIDAAMRAYDTQDNGKTLA